MARHDIFKIEILNFEKNNQKLKKGHTHFMLSKRFFDDPKIMSLTPVQKLLYLRLLTVRSESDMSPIEVHIESISSPIPLRPQFVLSSLDRLQENQLLTYEKKAPLYKIRENKVEKRTKKDINMYENCDTQGQLNFDDKKNDEKVDEKPKKKRASPPVAEAPVHIGRDLITVYIDAYKARYSGSPVFLPKDSKNLKDLGVSLGFDKTSELLKAYLKMDNFWFKTKAHDLPAFLTNLNQITNYLESGEIVTQADARNAESSSSLSNQVNRLKEGK